MRYEQVWGDARIRRIRDVTPSVREFELVPVGTAPRPHPVGSHVNIGVLIGGQPDIRSFSVVGESGFDCYRIAVKQQAKSRGGSAYMWSLPVGATLTVTDPHALFSIEYDRPEYLLVAGGIGITPLVGMALQLARRGAHMTLLYAIRTRAELAFLPELEAGLGERLQVFVGDEGRRIDLAAAFASLPDRAQAAVCGPLPMIDAARRAWAAAERPTSDIRFETFGSSGARAPEPFTVRLAGSGLEIVVPESRSMLDALAAAGVEVMSDCRRGECGICALDVVACDGEIDHRDVFFSDVQRRENRKICACVSRASGTVTIDTLYRNDAL